MAASPLNWGRLLSRVCNYRVDIKIEKDFSRCSIKLLNDEWIATQRKLIRIPKAGIIITFIFAVLTIDI